MNAIHKMDATSLFSKLQLLQYRLHTITDFLGIFPASVINRRIKLHEV